MFEQECVPYAPALIESMRSLGYSFSSAIADLIDNSISAEARKIEIISIPNISPSLIILDDGHGMLEQELYEAMRYGSHNPLDKRDEKDLGRFGLGLKSASLSQCRKLVVVSKKASMISCFSWDLDYVAKSGKWALKGYTLDEVYNYPYINKLLSAKQGTYIYLSEFDRIEEGANNLSETFNKLLSEMIDHLALVFHRFIDEGLVITVNDKIVESRDPFLLNNSATQRKKEYSIYIDQEKIVLKPYILPHFSKLSQEDIQKVGGKESLRNDQGFYVYRNKRLIIWGTWFRLERKDELNKLARVRVDIPNSLDYMWSIDIKKSTATLPDKIKKNMYAAVYESVLSSEAVQVHRGRKEKNEKDIDYVWERVKTRDGYEYQINTDIPQIKLFNNSLSLEQSSAFRKILKLLEEAFPTTAFYVDVAKGQIEDKMSNKQDSEEEIQRLWSELQEQIEYVKAHNLSVQEYYSAFMKVEPYCRYHEIVNLIKMEMEKND